MRLFFRLLLLAAIHLSLGELADKNAGNAPGFCEVRAVTGSRLIQEYFTRAPRSEKNISIYTHRRGKQAGFGIQSGAMRYAICVVCSAVEQQRLYVAGV